MTFKVGDKVRQTNESTYFTEVGHPSIPAPEEIGTVVEVLEDEQICYPYLVNYPRIDKGVWPFKENEIEQVEEEQA